MSTGSNSVPLVDLRAQHAEVADEISAGFSQVLASGGYIKGPDVAQFEREFAEYSGAVHCVGLGSGTDAVEFALRAAGIPAGAEVILPANTFVATAEAVVRAGLRPVLVDTDPDYLLIDPAAVAKAVRPETGAILPVHLFGQLAPMAPLAEIAGEHEIPIVEDAAQSHGASQDGKQPATYGVAAAVSFYPGKNLGAYGDAGAVLTNSDTVARNVRLLGDHGSEQKYIHAQLGFNSRLDSLQAVVLRAKLRKLEEWNERRRQAAARYAVLLDGLDEVVLPQTAPGNVHAWHLYVIQVPDRDRVLEALHALGIHAGVHYPVPVHLQPAFRAYGYAPGDFPVAEAAAERILSLPLYPHITPEQQAAVADALRQSLAAR
jgi:dTDP-4-amino-4,6-dideoxygalactose transaminase